MIYLIRLDYLLQNDVNLNKKGVNCAEKLGIIILKPMDTSWIVNDANYKDDCGIAG